MKEKQITIGGNFYTFTALVASDVLALLDEFKASAPDPVKEVLDTAAMLPDGIKDDFIKKHLDAAFESKRRAGTINDPAYQAYLSTTAGASKLVSRMLRKHHPHLTWQQAIDIASEGLAEHGDDLFRGLVPDESAGAHVGKGRGNRLLPK